MKNDFKDSDNDKKVKYTIVLPKSMLSEIKGLSQNGFIPSINKGIQEAIDALLKEKKKEQYLQQMEEAGKDPAFLKRTHEIQRAFENSDVEIDDSW